MDSVTCRQCGRRQDLPSGNAPRRFRCLDCGAVNDAPTLAKARAATPFDDDSPEPPQVKSARAQAERELLIQGTHEDDFNPYTVRGDALTAACPECKKPIRPQSVVCAHCGINLDEKKKAERTFTPIERTWESGWTFRRRLAAFIVLQVINVIAFVVLWNSVSGAITVTGAALTVLLAAFLLGTYDRLHLVRTIKGKVTLTRTWRWGFIERAPVAIRWKEHESVRIIESTESDPIDWCFAALLFTYGVLPGVVFWFFVILPEKFEVVLCKDHGYAALLLLRTQTRSRAQDVTDQIHEATGMPIS